MGTKVFDVTGKVFLKLTNIQFEIEIAYDDETGKLGELTNFKIDSNGLGVDEISFDINDYQKFMHYMALNPFITWLGRQLRPVIVPLIKDPFTKEVSKMIAGKTIAEVIATIG